MAQFSRLKIWNSGEVLYATDLNNEFNNLLNGFTPNLIDGASASVSAMQASSDPGNIGTENLIPNNLLGEVQKLRYVVKELSGEAQWYVPPANNIKTLASFYNNTVRTDGGNPGLYGFTSIAFGNVSTSTTASNTTVSNILGTVILTKGINPVEIKCYKNNSVSNNSPGISISTSIANAKVGNFYASTVTFTLVKDGVDFDKSTFLILDKIQPSVSDNLIGGSVQYSFTASSSGNTVVNGPAGTVGGGITTQMGATTGSALTITTLNSQQTLLYIPFSAFSWLDISAAEIGAQYALRCTVTSPTFSNGETYSCQATCSGFLAAKEII